MEFLESHTRAGDTIFEKSINNRPKSTVWSNFLCLQDFFSGVWGGSLIKKYNKYQMLGGGGAVNLIGMVRFFQNLKPNINPHSFLIMLEFH